MINQRATHSFVFLLACIFFTAVGIFGFFSFAHANVTRAVTELSGKVNSTSVLLRGYYYADDDKLRAVWFEWGVDSGSLNRKTSIQQQKKRDKLSALVSNLKTGERYYYRLVVQDSDGTLYRGSPVHFFVQGGSQSRTISGSSSGGGTSSGDVYSLFQRPVVRTRSANHITATSAVLNGHAIRGTKSTETTVWFQWGSQPSLSNVTPPRTFTGEESDFSVPILGLKTNIQYYYRAVAENEDGVSLGQILTFVTGTGGVVSEDASNDLKVVTGDIRPFPTSATVQGYAFLGDDAALGWFEWGTTSSLGNKTATTPLTKPVSLNIFSQVLNNLVPNTTYYIRAVAEDRIKVQKGNIIHFTTPPLPPLQTTPQKTSPKTTTPPKKQSVQETVLFKIQTDKNQVSAGDEIHYTLLYENKGDAPLRGAVFLVLFPPQIIYQESNTGEAVYKDGKANISIGSVEAHASGAVLIRAKMEDTETGSEILTTNAVMSFTDPVTGSPKELKDTISHSFKKTSGADTNNEGAALILGTGFWPSTIIGWMAFFLLFILLVLAILKLYDTLSEKGKKIRTEQKKPISASMIKAIHQSDNT